MVILTAEQAAEVRGVDKPHFALDPAVLADGVTYVLGVETLTDPNHSKWHDYLAALPVRDVADKEFVQPKEL